MRTLLIGLVALLAGVGGTLGLQALDDDDPSDECRATEAWVKTLILNKSEAQEGGFILNTTLLEDIDRVLDIRYKACHP